MVSLTIISYKKIIAKQLWVAKASLTLPNPGLESSPRYKHTLPILTIFLKFTLVIFTLSYILLN